MDLVIRKAEMNELPLLQDLSEEVINLNYRSFLSEEIVDFFINSGSSNQYIEENINDLFVAVFNEELVGICVCKANLIDMLMIKNEYQGKNIGSYFFNQISENLFKVYEQIRLESFENNTKANRFYIKNGWEIEKICFDEEINGNKVYFYKNRDGE